MAQHADHPGRRARPLPAVGPRASVAARERGEHAERPQPPRPSPASTWRDAASSAARASAWSALRRARSTSAHSLPGRLDRKVGAAEQPRRMAEQRARPAPPHRPPAPPRRAARRRAALPTRPSSPRARRRAGAWAAIPCRTGSGGGGARSSRSSASRHQASRIRLTCRLAPGGEDRAQSGVKTPERLERGARGGRHVGEREAAVGVEGAAQR